MNRVQKSYEGKRKIAAMEETEPNLVTFSSASEETETGDFSHNEPKQSLAMTMRVVVNVISNSRLPRSVALRRGR